MRALLVDALFPRLLLDQGVPRDDPSRGRFGLYARGRTWDVHCGRPAIVELARKQDAVIVTLDADFHAELAVSGAAKPFVVRLRMQGLSDVEVARIVLEIFKDHAQALAAGCLITVKRSKVTSHKLPIGTRGVDFIP